MKWVSTKFTKLRSGHYLNVMSFFTKAEVLHSLWTLHWVWATSTSLQTHKRTRKPSFLRSPTLQSAIICLPQYFVGSGVLNWWRFKGYPWSPTWLCYFGGYLCRGKMMFRVEGRLIRVMKYALLIHKITLNEPFLEKSTFLVWLEVSNVKLSYYVWHLQSQFWSGEWAFAVLTR